MREAQHADQLPTARAARASRRAARGGAGSAHGGPTAASVTRISMHSQAYTRQRIHTKLDVERQPTTWTGCRRDVGSSTLGRGPRDDRSDEIEARTTPGPGPGSTSILGRRDRRPTSPRARRLNPAALPMHDCTELNSGAEASTPTRTRLIVLHAPEPVSTWHGALRRARPVRRAELAAHRATAPITPAVPLDSAYVETSTVARRPRRRPPAPDPGFSASSRSRWSTSWRRLRDFLTTSPGTLMACLEQQFTRRPPRPSPNSSSRSC
jgi:hypothetical protein